MDKESHEENNHIVSADSMAKRKRGRPRKHMKIASSEQSLFPPPPPGFSMIQQQSLPPPPGFSRIEQPPRQRDDDEPVVGQPITGVIEAKFEAGFLLAVKVGNSDSMLRGVVFKPGRFDPVSADNDVAPHVPMIRRNSNTMHLHGSAKGGRKSRFREKRGGDIRSRALVPVPIQPARPTIPENMVVPVVLQPVNLQNGGRQVLVRHSPMQAETGSEASGANNGKPFETLLTQVMNKSQAHQRGQSTEAESDEQALSIEPLQAIHPVHPVHMPKPMPSYGGGGKMTELLQAMQENVKETHFSQGQ